MLGPGRVASFFIVALLACCLVSCPAQPTTSPSPKRRKSPRSSPPKPPPAPAFGRCPCATGLICGANSTCACPAGTTFCGTADGCRNLARDDDEHCGSCNNKCSGGSSCRGAKCMCPQGKFKCGAACVDPRSYQKDEKNCGGCGTVCGTGQTCDDSVCVCSNIVRVGSAPLSQFWNDDKKTCEALNPGECKGGFLTAVGGFNHTARPTPDQPQNVFFAFLASASYGWFWGLTPKATDTPMAGAALNCMQRWGVVGQPIVRRRQLKAPLPGAYQTTVMRTAEDVFVVLRGGDDDGKWLTPLGAEMESSGVLFNAGGDVRLQQGVRSVYDKLDRDLLKAVRNAVAAIKKPNSNSTRVYVMGHGLGGGLAAVAALRLTTVLAGGAAAIGGVYLFNSPRVGNDGWRSAFNDRLGNKTFHFRLAKDYFEVPSPSAGFRDVGTSVLFCPNRLVVNFTASQDAHSSMYTQCQLGGDWGPSMFWPSKAVDILQDRVGNPCTLAATKSCKMLENCRASVRPKGNPHPYHQQCLGCFADSDCASLGFPVAFCANSQRNSTNTCQASVPNGGVCRFDRDCASEHCVTGTCRACKEDRDCLADTFCEASTLRPENFLACRPAFRRGEACSRDRQCRSEFCSTELALPTCT